jgi:hypothetical protein
MSPILKPKYFDQGVKMAISKSKRSGLQVMPEAETLIQVNSSLL